ncbi:MAG TPA: MerR family transcriptional regulator [Vicinamibacterales bacterium]|nr:MerR family transcriptional regulator [Vicinamibacterales bacterium]
MGASSKRELFKAADVCEVAQLQPYVLRSWEAEFPQIGQAAPSGARVYRRADVELVLRIKRLVFEEGLTLSGARRRLEEESGSGHEATGDLVEDAVGDAVRDRLKHVKAGLESILQMLSRDGDAQPELQLVPPAAAKKKAATKTKTKK